MDDLARALRPFFTPPSGFSAVGGLLPAPPPDLEGNVTDAPAVAPDEIALAATAVQVPVVARTGPATRSPSAPSPIQDAPVRYFSTPSVSRTPRRWRSGALLGILASAVIGAVVLLLWKPGHEAPSKQTDAASGIAASNVKTRSQQPDRNPKPPPPKLETQGAKRAPEAADSEKAEITKLTPAEANRLLEWAKRAAAGGRYGKPPGDNAAELLTRIERDFPEHAGTRSFRRRFCRRLVRRAKRHAQKGRYGAAQRNYSHCLTIAPHHGRALWGLAGLHTRIAERALRKKRYAAAEERADDALKLKPNYGHAHELLGDVAMRRRRYVDAIAHYRASLDANHPRRRKRVVQRKLRVARRRAKRAASK
jgi:hypothetical protein